MEQWGSATWIGIGAIVGQFITMWTIHANAKNARAALAAAATESAAAIAAAAKLQDDRADRDRKWLVEDRQALAGELARKVEATAAAVAATVQTTADTLAAKVAADQHEIARVAREHAAEIAAIARTDQMKLASNVDAATVVATTAVGELKELVVGVGEKADAAHHEANGAKVLIAAVNQSLADEVQRRNDIQVATAVAADAAAYNAAKEKRS